MTTTTPTPTPTPAAPKTGAHKFRMTWPMIVGWLTVLSLLAPMVAPYVTGEKKLDAAGICALLASLVAALNHSPLGTPGGGLPKVPPAVVGLLVLLFFPLLSGCGASWQSGAQTTLGLGSRVAVVADHMVAAEAQIQCAGDAACVHSHHLDTANDSIAAAKSAIAAGEAALAQAAHSGAKAVWDAVAPCVAASIASVMHALIDAGVHIPAWLDDIAAGIVAFLGPCQAPSST